MFRATASDQPRAAEGDRFANARLALSFAYTPSQPIIDPAMFAGRLSDLGTLIRSIEEQRLHVVTYGERGIGKTSLIHVLSHAARDARYLVSYTSCGADSAFDEVIRTVGRDIPLLFHNDYGPGSPEAERGDTLADLLPPPPLSVRQATEAFAKVMGTRLLLVLDEFDRVESPDFRLSIAELIKGLSDRAIRVQVLIAGVAANLTELVDHVPSIQRSIMALPLPRMTDAEVRELIQVGGERGSLVFEEVARARIVAVADGLPYLASLISHHAGVEAINKSRLDVTAADVDAAISKALSEHQSRISKRSLAHIATCVDEGAIGVLGGLAGLAQRAGGLLSSADLASASSWPGGVGELRSMVERLAAERALLERREGDNGLAFRFLEDGVPIYVWLLAAQLRLQEKGAGPARFGFNRGASAGN